MKPVSWKGLSRVALVSALLTLSIGRSWGAKDIGPQEYTGEGSAKQATDFKNPLRVPNKPNTYHVTICDNNSWTGVWYPPEWKGNTGRVKGNSTEKDHGHAKEEDGTGGGVQMMGSSVGTTDVALTKENGQTVHLIIRVIHCDNSNKGHRGVTENATALPTGNFLERLIQDGQVKIDNEGTGETIGHVADLKIDNVTDQPVNCVVPPMVLESKSEKNQDYVCPKSETVMIDPHGTATVPVDGVCVARNKPPVGKGVTGDLVINTGDPNVPQNPDSHIPAKQVRDLVRICTSKYDAADKLQKDGNFRDLPYHDKQKQKDIVVQWSTWSDPEISEITGAPPATKDDLKKVVYKQVEEKGPMTPATRKKVDQGIDTIFEKVELTTAKAKDLEKPDQYAQTEPGGGTFEISDNQGQSTESPPPQTQEKPKKDKKKKKWPKPVQDWVDKKKASDDAEKKKKAAQFDYTYAFHTFCYKNKHYIELLNQRDAAKEKANAPRATQADRDNYDKAKREVEKLEGELDKEFKQTDDGKKEFQKVVDAEKGANQAQDAAKEAEKNLPTGVDKDAVQKAEDEAKKAEEEPKKKANP